MYNVEGVKIRVGKTVKEIDGYTYFRQIISFKNKTRKEIKNKLAKRERLLGPAVNF